MKESANLDLLRAIAVALVVLDHVGLSAGWRNDVFMLEAVGRAGVGLFFVHTACVLMHSLERRQERALAFYVRRFFRIYPLSCAIVLVAALGSDHLQNHGALIANLLLVQNITGHKSAIVPLWSLPYEVQMYLVLPLLYLVTRTGNAVIKIATLLVVTLALAASGLSNLLTYVPCFMAGVLAFTLPRCSKTVSPLILFGYVFAAVLVISVLELSGWDEPPLLWAMCVGLGMLLPITREIKTGVLSRCAAFVARYSYSIYLTHWPLPIAIGFSIHGVPQIAQVAVCFAAIAVMVYLTDRWIEQPGITLGKKLAARINSGTPGKRHSDNHVAVKTNGRAEATGAGAAASGTHTPDGLSHN